MQPEPFPPTTIQFRVMEALPQVQSGQYNQDRNHYFEEQELPHRFIRHWSIVRWQNGRYFLVSLNPNDFRFVPGDTLVGYLVPRNEITPEIEMQVPCDTIQISMDRDPASRGYWFNALQNPSAWYRLCQPYGGFHPIPRAVLAAVSYVTDAPLQKKHNVKDFLQCNRIHTPELDVKIVSFLKKPIGKHLVGAKDGGLLDEDSLFLVSLSKLKFPVLKRDHPTNEQLDAWSSSIEKKLNQEPWGEQKAA